MSWDARAAKAAEPVWLYQRVAPGRNALKHVEALATTVRYSRGQAIYEEDSAVDTGAELYRVSQGGFR